MIPSSDVELFQSSLDATQLEALQADLRELTEVLATIPKRGGVQMVKIEDMPLDQGFLQLTSGAIHGLQIRYRHEGTEWWDTLLRSAEGVRLVRRKM